MNKLDFSALIKSPPANADTSNGAVVVAGKLPRAVFAQGLALWRSCNGPEVDKRTLELWFRMLAHLEPQAFAQAVSEAIKHESNLSFLNFVGVVNARAEAIQALRSARERGQEWQENLKRWEGEELVSRETVRKWREKMGWA